MKTVLALSKRNCLCFFRDRASVVFSLMAALIVVMLYLLFLRDMMVSSYPDMPGMDNLVDAWVLSGIVGIVSVTTSAGSLQIMVEDRAGGRIEDVLVTPMGPYRIAGGYILGTFAVGLTMGAVVLAVSTAYLVATGCPLSAGGVLSSFLLTVPSALSGSIVMYTLSTFFKTNGSFSGMFTVVSVMIGFVAGIYMPVGSMPSAMQAVSSFVPVSQFCSLFRQNLAGDALENVFGGLPVERLSEFRTDMGFDLYVGDVLLDPVTMAVYIAAVTALFFAIAVVMVRRR